MNRSLVSIVVTLACGSLLVVAQQATPEFTWPNARRVAVFLSSMMRGPARSTKARRYWIAMA